MADFPQITLPLISIAIIGIASLSWPHGPAAHAHTRSPPVADAAPSPTECLKLSLDAAARRTSGAADAESAAMGERRETCRLHGYWVEILSPSDPGEAARLAQFAAAVRTEGEIEQASGAFAAHVVPSPIAAGLH
jgi:hypothetical protein